jgi:galactose mutarotase-like enzyme
MRAYTITSKDGLTQATFIPERGGSGSSMVMPGEQGPRELLFFDKDRFSGWPFCFPVCGRLERQGRLNSYYYDGHEYELPIHGFAKNKPWTVIDSDSEHLLLELRDDEETRRVYPFHFTVQLHYEIANRRLTCRQTYINHGDRPMPYYAGFHPYFLTPPPAQGKAQVMLNFAARRRLRYNQNLTEIVGEQSLFNVPVSVANPEIHEQLMQLGEDKTVHLRYPGKDVLSMAAEGVEDINLFSYLQLYSPPDQPFICTEPWMGVPNSLNSVAGVRWLAPGASEHGVLRLWLE